MDRPNILFIQVDQLMVDALRCHGGQAIAPALDRLADGGVVFERAYCNFPLCSPSRASMAAGQLCSTIGAYDNAAELPASVPTYAHYLRAVGYQTALSGKMHFIGPDQFHGFEQRLTPDLYPADFSWVPNWGNEGKRDTNDARAVRISGVCRRNVQLDFDGLAAEAAVAHLQALGQSADARPFFLQVSFTHPHEPFQCTQDFWDLYEGVALAGPPVGPLAADDLDPHSHRLLSDFGMLDAGFTGDEIARVVRAYHGAVSYIDSLVARVLGALRDAGLAERTVIVFASDHGEMLGARGLWFKKHFFERSLRVPLFVSAPWIAPRRVATLTSLVDLLPTFAGFAGAELVEPLEGMDLGPLIAGGAEMSDRTVHAEYLAEATPAPILMVRRGRWKFVTSPVDGHMLYDLEADPLERENLANDRAHAETVTGFEAEVAAKWDVAALERDIKQSQQRRLLIRAAMGQGAPVRWNHGEAADEIVPWYRGQGGYDDWAFAHD